MKRTLLMPICLLMLAACGGGGGGHAEAGSPAGGGSAGNGDGDVTLNEVRIETTYGIVEGTAESGVRTWLGVRYAAAPTGSLRFRPPQEPAVIEGVTQTKSAPPVCAQILRGTNTGDEDCLFLNVWAPDDEETHPVMVLLHGGTTNGIDGSQLATTTGLVVIAPNRRVGVLAKLALQELVDESPDHTGGNLDILDTIAALHWVQDNVAAFGGDPEHVMLVGFSAGGATLCGLFAAPLARGLFQSAAVTSGVCYGRFVTSDSINEYTPHPPLDELQAPLIERTGCDGASSVMACLRELPADTLLQAAAELPPAPPTKDVSVFPIVPVIDGVVVTTNPYDGLAAQVAGNFPLIAGSTRDETRNLLSFDFMDDAAYQNWLNASFGSEVAAQLYAAYPPADYPTPTDAAYMLTADLVFGCPAEALAKAASGQQSAYLYLVTQGRTMYAAHGSGPLLAGITQETDQPWADLASAARSAWSTLAANPGLAPEIDAGSFGTFMWPVYAPDNVEVLELGDPVQIVDQYRDARCDVLGPIVDFHF